MGKVSALALRVRPHRERVEYPVRIIVRMYMHVVAAVQVAPGLRIRPRRLAITWGDSAGGGARRERGASQHNEHIPHRQNVLALEPGARADLAATRPRRLELRLAQGQLENYLLKLLTIRSGKRYFSHVGPLSTERERRREGGGGGGVV